MIEGDLEVMEVVIGRRIGWPTAQFKVVNLFLNRRLIRPWLKREWHDAAINRRLQKGRHVAMDVEGRGFPGVWAFRQPVVGSRIFISMALSSVVAGAEWRLHISARAVVERRFDANQHGWRSSRRFQCRSKSDRVELTSLVTRFEVAVRLFNASDYVLRSYGHPRHLDRRVVPMEQFDLFAQRRQ